MAPQECLVTRAKPIVQGHVLLSLILRSEKQAQVAQPLLAAHPIQATRRNQVPGLEGVPREQVVLVERHCAPRRVVVQQRQREERLLLVVGEVQDGIDGRVVKGRGEAGLADGRVDRVHREVRAGAGRGLNC
ncbi:MAG: hypothetical protein GIKADHBN_00253 [Phycisphaerales bacterium]|nr:hypothetical protein [Phycisphaerales bacterium]